MWELLIEIIQELICSETTKACSIPDSETPFWSVEKINEEQPALDFFTEKADLARQVSTLTAEAPPDEDPFPFGKHGPNEGQKSYGEVPDSYYGWLSQEHWVSDRWPEVAAYIEANNL